jgi:hypothetical protein
LSLLVSVSVALRAPAGSELARQFAALQLAALLARLAVPS